MIDIDVLRNALSHAQNLYPTAKVKADDAGNLLLIEDGKPIAWIDIGAVGPGDGKVHRFPRLSIDG